MGSGIVNNPACGLVDNTGRCRFLIVAGRMELVEIKTGNHLMTEQHFALRVGLGHRAQDGW
jgi:hypothetical protein